MEAGGADASGIERVPLMPAGAEPLVVLAGRPAAERAADAGAIGAEALVLVEVVIQNNVVRERAHAQIL